MTPEQAKIAEWLKVEVSTLYSAYIKAVEMMDGPDFPGRTNLVCHCCRDICTSIQQHHGVKHGGNAKTTPLLSYLDVLWSQQKLDDLTQLGISRSPDADQSVLRSDAVVPIEILRMVQSVLIEHRRGGLNQKSQAVAMFEALAPEGAGRQDLFETHSEQWKGLRGWFHTYAHFGIEERVCDVEELKSQFAVLETHLLTMVLSFYEGVEKLEKLLPLVPSKENVARAIALMVRPEQQRYFFAKLDNPAWLGPLKERGMFSKLPELVSDPVKGTRSVGDWPAGSYISRMAEKDPTSVMEILLALPDTDSPFVIRFLLQSALAMPAKLVEKLAPKIAKAPFCGFWIPAEMIGRVAVNLAAGGESAAALLVLKSVLSVVPSESPQTPSDRRPMRRKGGVTVLSQFDYANLLRLRGSDLAKHLGIPYLSLLCSLLRTALGLEYPIDKSSSAKSEDYSFVWQARLESGSLREDAKQLLIPAVLAAGNDLCTLERSTLPEVMGTLGKYRFKVYDRIAFRIMSDQVKKDPTLAASMLLNKDSLIDRSVKQEFDMLASAAFGCLKQEEQNIYLGWIDEGIDFERLQANGYSPEEAVSANEQWAFQRLSPIRKFLSADRAKTLSLMEEKLGSPKTFSNPVAQGGPYAHSDRSPTSLKMLGAMEAERVIEYVNVWEPSANDPFPFGYTKEGLGSSFSSIVSQAPHLYAPHIESLSNLDPIYVSSALRGFKSALLANIDFDVSAVIGLALWVSQRPEITPPGDRNTRTKDDFSNAKHDVIELIDEGLKQGKLPYGLHETIWEIIALLSEDEWGILDYRNPESLNFDAWFHSLNYLRPKAVRAAFQYLGWSAKNTGQKAFLFSRAKELAGYFEKHTDPSHEVCLSVWLIFGELFPYLHALDPKWATASVSRIFPNTQEHRALRDVTWAAYLAANHAYDNVVQLLEPQYRAAINIHDDSRSLGKSNLLENVSGMMGRHLLEQYWWGKIDLFPNSLLGDFFQNAEPDGRKSVITYVGRSLIETEEDISTDIISRLVALWDTRLQAAVAGGPSEEMHLFSWWFFTRYFEDEWALENLYAAVKLTKGHLALIMTSLDRLSRLADRYPGLVIACLKLMVDASPEYEELWEPDITKSLVSALSSSDSKAVAAAQNLIENLGIKGRFGYRRLLPCSSE